MDAIKQQLVKLLEKSEAHAGFDAAVAHFPPEKRGIKPPGATHTAWELLEHLRLAQEDILEFSRDPSYESPAWPEGYWPKTPEPPDAAAWDNSIASYKRDAAAVAQLISDPASDLLKPFTHGDGQTLFREALVLLDHNAYHVGELVMLRVILGIWKS